MLLFAGGGCGELAKERSGGAGRSLPLLGPPQLHHVLQPPQPLLGARDELRVVDFQGLLKETETLLCSHVIQRKTCDGHRAEFSKRLLK